MGGAEPHVEPAGRIAIGQTGLVVFHEEVPRRDVVAALWGDRDDRLPISTGRQSRRVVGRPCEVAVGGYPGSEVLGDPVTPVDRVRTGEGEGDPVVARQDGVKADDLLFADVGCGERQPVRGAHPRPTSTRRWGDCEAVTGETVTHDASSPNRLNDSWSLAAHTVTTSPASRVRPIVAAKAS